MLNKLIIIISAFMFHMVASSKEVIDFSVIHPKELCPTACPKIILPVCGFDGEKYQIFHNYCILQKGECEERKEWKIVDLTTCGENSIGGTIQISSEVFDESVENKCSTQCSDKPLNPVCAFNGNEYKLFLNKCKFMQENCRKNEWHQTSIGDCNDVFLRATKKQCLKPCPHVYFPLCAFDGVNYRIFPNQCTFDIQNCYENSKWRKTTFGECSGLFESTYLKN